MQWNPYLHALGALAYVGLVVLFMRFIEKLRHDTPDTLMDGMGFMTLFVLSVATMAFLFFYRPVALLIEDKKSEAVAFFLKTLGTFAVATVFALTFATLQ
ncbi:MAG: hypothetical protein RLZZ234_538 [Candidatus Parcubacteria bacterium]|jgi:hypothetical protein